VARMLPDGVALTTKTMSEDDEMRQIVTECDAYMGAKTSPTDAFFDLVNKHDALLRRTAKYLRQPGSDEKLMPPSTLRVCASYLLNN